MQLKQKIALNKGLDYRAARQFIFAQLDNENGKVCSVYGGLCMETHDIPKSTLMNVEHTWPQSRGAKGMAKADLHHLFAVDAKINSRRGNLEFCEVADIEWEESGNFLGRSVNGSNRCFEPRDEHKGNVARALFYFAVRYDMPISESEEGFLRRWHQNDPVDAHEMDRNNKIQSLQGNRNPFIDQPALIQEFQDL